MGPCSSIQKMCQVSSKKTAYSSGVDNEIVICEPLLSCYRMKFTELFQCIVFLPESFGTVSVYHCALPTMPTVCEKEPPRGAHNC